MHHRRDFLKNTSMLLTGLAFSPTLSALHKHFPDSQKDDFWAEIRKLYPIADAPLINLNSGSAGTPPIPVQEALQSYYERSYTKPLYYIWNEWQEARNAIKAQIAQNHHCHANELAFLRNTTEGLNTILYGFPLQEGDEVVAARHDYPNALKTLEHLCKHKKVNLKIVEFNLPLEDDDTFLETYAAAFTEKTKLVLFTHVTHAQGQILPIKKLCAFAQSKGIDTLVDAAHSFSHIDHKIGDLGCDYYATSLHKWLCAPYGTGLLYVKDAKIPKIAPIHIALPPDGEKINKLEATGTRAYPIDMGIGAAVAFEDTLKIGRKQARLQHLKNYWTKAVASLENVDIRTSLDPAYSCAIASFSIKGKSMRQVKKALKERFHVHTKTVGLPVGSAIRITPNVYTLEKDLDVLVEGIFELSDG